MKLCFQTDTLSHEFTKSLLRPGGSFPSLICQWTRCLPKRHTIQSCPFHIDCEIKNGTQGDGAQHSITLLTNTSELDSKDTINQKAGTINPLSNGHQTHSSNLWTLVRLRGDMLFSSERQSGCTCCVCPQTKGTSTGSTFHMTPASRSNPALIGLYKSFVVFNMSFITTGI